MAGLFAIVAKPLGIGLLAGLVTFLLLPALTLSKLSDAYISLAMQAVRRGLLVKRSTSGYNLRAARPADYADGVERITLAGKTRDFRDDNGNMGRLKQRPFGVVHEDRSYVLSPAEADVSREYLRLKRSGDWLAQTDGGQQARRKWAALTPGVALVDPAACVKTIQGSTSPRLPEVVKEFQKKAQQGFNTGRAVTYTVWLMFFGAGAGGPYILSKVADGSGGIIDQPIQLMPMLLGVIA